MHVQIGIELGAATTPFHLTNVLLDDAAAKTFALDLEPRVGNAVTAATPSSGLQHALQLAPGRHIAFRVRHAGSMPASLDEEIRSLEIRIGLLGDLFIETDRGARASVVPTDQMLAFHDRSGPADPLLDALVLACGLMPLDDTATTWSDAPAARLLPKMGFRSYARLLLLPLSPALATVYCRKWNAVERAFVQSGRHVHSIAGIALDVVDTEVMIDEALGISCLRLSSRGRILIEAHLVAVGLRPDLGIPGWSCGDPVPVPQGKAA